jgi:hypothetical protein
MQPTIFCLLKGDKTPFYVVASPTISIGELKNVIKKRRATIFEGSSVDASLAVLTLCKVRHFQWLVVKLRVTIDIICWLITSTGQCSLLHLDESITGANLEYFPLSKYASRHRVDHARFENVASAVHDGIKRLFDPRKTHLSVWVWIHDPEDN